VAYLDMFVSYRLQLAQRISGSLRSATDFTKWRNHNLNNKAGYISVKLAGEVMKNDVLKLKNKFVTQLPKD
jgi:hypothetical protein